MFFIIKNKKKSAFTLVELIIVITILAILATIAFVSFQGYVKGGRDSNRLATLSSIKKGLETFSIQAGNYPNPDGTIVSGNINGQNLVKVGEIQDQISSLVKIKGNAKDPLTQNFYAYGVSFDNKFYQIASIKENLTSFTPGISSTYAGNEGLTANVDGNYNGILKFSSGTELRIANIPGLIYNNTGTVDLLSSGTYFVINKKTNLPYSSQGVKDITIKNIDGNSLIKDITKSASSTLTGVNITNISNVNISSIFTGSVLASFNVFSSDPSNTGFILTSIQSNLGSVVSNVVQIGANSTMPGLSCLDILNKGSSTGNGLYWIKPDSNPAFQVYCDMTTDGGGWTRVVGINSTNLNHASASQVAWTSSDPTSYGKLSDTMINTLKSSTSSTTVSFRLQCGSYTSYFPGSCLFTATNQNLTALADCRSYKKNYADASFVVAGSVSDGCSSPSYYGGLSSYKYSTNCSTLGSDSGYVIYRRTDWRGTSYDNGCKVVGNDNSTTGNTGALFVR